LVPEENFHLPEAAGANRRATPMAVSIDLSNRCVLVTGASRGIGRAIAVTLAEAGAAVAVNYVQSQPEAEAVVDAIRQRAGKAVAIRADVSSAAEVAAMVAAVERDLGPIDILVNNAGIALHWGVDDISEADFDRTLAVNLKSAFLCTQAVVGPMRSRRWGRIVNISSGAARGGGAVGVHYNASKSGLEGLTRGYAARLVRDGITVNAVAPSLIATDMLPDAAAAAAKVPLGRLGLSEEVAQAVLMVLGNAYMTGQTVALNGGMHFN
jgi:3-oxoacyl-[acyl-carrier protein] reductase